MKLLPTTARILIVDDDSELRDVLVRAVRAAGYETVAAAPNGNDAMLLGSVLPFDLIITDLVMPEVGGMELILWFRKVQPAAKIITISGAHEGALLPAAQLPGASAVIHKPFRTDVLLAIVRDVLSRKADSVSE